MLNGEILHIKKPDKDNLAKIIGDGLNHIAWHDDSKIVMGETIKFYRKYQGVYLVITPIDKMDKNLLEWIDEQVEKEEK
jgi:Holliday junction resolvase RusA-like endonuclease